MTTAQSLEQAEDDASLEDGTSTVDDTQQTCGHADGVVEIEVVGEDDLPLMGIGVELSCSPRRALRARTDRRGRVRFEGLPSGSYTASLFELDQDAWEELDREALDVDQASGRARLTWITPSSAAAGRVHTVEQGECVAKLAERYGLALSTVWEHADNEALRSERGSPYVLLAGDTLVIPAHERRELGVALGHRHRIRRRGVPDVLRVRFVDAAGEPWASRPFLVKLELHDGTAVPDLTGVTDGAGVMELSVPPATVRAVVTIEDPSGDPIEHELHVGHLDPIDTPTGLRDHLRNLGLPHDLAPAEGDEHAQWSLRWLQREQAADATGELDDAARASLTKRHDF